MVNRHNEGEIETAQRLAEELGVDQLDLAPLRCDMGRELFMDNEAQIQSAEPWLPAQEGLSLYDYAGKEKKRVREKDCDWLWTRMVVNWNGSVSPCCAVWDEKYDFGNVDQRSFFRIWNGKRYRQARRIVAGREPPASDNVCGICVSHRAQI